MNKKLLVLGIGHSQVDLIKIAKEMGMSIYACAYSSEGPGKALVDGFKQIDIKDVKAVKDYAIEKQVDFIFTMGLEIALPTIAKVSEELNLPTFFSTETFSKLQNKAQWREILGDLQGNIQFKSGKTIDEFSDWNIYPAILKPVDGSGQRGVYRVDNYSHIKNIFSESIKHSRSKELIIEDYVEGLEISVNTFMYKGELKFAIVSDRISYTEYPGGIIKEHRIPSETINYDMEEKIKTLVNEVNERMGFKNGHVYFQLKIENDQAKLIEFTPRFDGCHMWRLIYLSTGLDLRKVSLELLATGKSPSLENYQYKLKPGNYITKFISDKPNTIVNRKNYDIPKETLYIDWYYQDGDKVNTVTGHLEKIGYMIIRK